MSTESYWTNDMSLSLAACCLAVELLLFLSLSYHSKNGRMLQRLVDLSHDEPRVVNLCLFDLASLFDWSSRQRFLDDRSLRQSSTASERLPELVYPVWIEYSLSICCPGSSHESLRAGSSISFIRFLSLSHIHRGLYRASLLVAIGFHQYSTCSRLAQSPVSANNVVGESRDTSIQRRCSLFLIVRYTLVRPFWLQYFFPCRSSMGNFSSSTVFSSTAICVIIWPIARYDNFNVPVISRSTIPRRGAMSPFVITDNSLPCKRWNSRNVVSVSCGTFSTYSSTRSFRSSSF